MNSQEAVFIYEAIAVVTGQMLVAARDANWTQLANLEKICAQHIETIKKNDLEAAQGAIRQRKIEIIHKILADDREIRNITDPWMTKLSMQINNIGAQRKLAQAYGIGRSG